MQEEQLGRKARTNGLCGVVLKDPIGSIQDCSGRSRTAALRSCSDFKCQILRQFIETAAHISADSCTCPWVSSCQDAGALDCSFFQLIFFGGFTNQVLRFGSESKKLFVFLIKFF